MDILAASGFIGATCILVAFFQASSGRWQGTSWQFQIVNLVGAAILVVYSWALEAHALVILNSIWIVVAGRGLYYYFRRKT